MGHLMLALALSTLMIACQGRPLAGVNATQIGRRSLLEHGIPEDSWGDARATWCADERDGMIELLFYVLKSPYRLDRQVWRTGR